MAVYLFPRYKYVHYILGGFVFSCIVILCTHPNAGAHPISKLDVLDPRFPLDVSVYAYPWYKHNDMNRSATPAVAFTAVMTNPLKETVMASFMFNLPLGIEPRTQRFAHQMAPDSSDSSSFKRSSGGLPSSSPLKCFETCSLEASCMSWSYDTQTAICYVFPEVRLNGHDDNSFAGVKVRAWSSLLQSGGHDPCEVG